MMREIWILLQALKKMLAYEDIMGAQKYKYLKEAQNLRSQRYETSCQDKTWWKVMHTYIWQLEDRTDDLFYKKMLAWLIKGP